ncbi:MAG: NAD(P)H-hydrate epimerase [Gracilimonas sp.]
MNLRNTKNQPLSLKQFQVMDALAVEKFKLPVELMMENAGLQLARRVSAKALVEDIIVIGAGNGNNGGGGLVAARRLAGWGYSVFLDLPFNITKELPQKQLQRALAFGAKTVPANAPAVWVDAYLGFSQRLPLSEPIKNSIQKANQSDAYRISLDLPTGISPNPDEVIFDAKEVLTLAAHKKILNHLPESVAIYIADIGLPAAVYKEFGLLQPEFNKDQIIPL